MNYLLHRTILQDTLSGIGYAYSSTCGLSLFDSFCSSGGECFGGVEGLSSRGLREGTLRTLVLEGKTGANGLMSFTVSMLIV